ncbi:hypothetical protein IH768_28715, partial [Escherichia coli]|nr:hypothetical protein [Escherichia coli]
ILKAMQAEGTGRVGLQLAEQYRKMLLEEPLEILNEAELDKEREASWQRQR